jgi:hypothetical protein
MLSVETRLLTGIILISIPTIEYGGYFLLGVLSGKYRELGLNEFQKAMFRAGHAHAGVIIILSVLCQVLADFADLPAALLWTARLGIPLSALLISGGFFFSAMGKERTRPNKLVGLIYAGVLLLAAGLILLGAGLIRSAT